MDELTRAVDAKNEGQQLAQTDNSYASITQQIQEIDVAVAQAQETIADRKLANANDLNRIKQLREERARLNRRRRVFADAKHRLQMIDEGL